MKINPLIELSKKYAELETKSAYRFLTDVIEGQHWPIKIIFNPARFTSKCY